MAKVTITIEDVPDGTVKVRSEFDPPLDRAEIERDVEKATPAQQLGMYATMQLAETDDEAETDIEEE